MYIYVSCELADAESRPSAILLHVRLIISSERKIQFERGQTQTNTIYITGLFFFLRGSGTMAEDNRQTWSDNH